MAGPGYRKLLLAAVVVLLAFWALNYQAYDGYFQDDELDNLSWAPWLDAAHYTKTFAKPLFDSYNFRPTGHLYFTLMGKAFGLDFAPYMTPIFVAHVLNGVLLFFILRRMKIAAWFALGGAAFFLLSGSAMDAYWKPMYVFDLFCTTFCLASILLWAYRQWVLSFLAYWLAYKAKELAVMLPFVLLAWELWLAEGRKRYVFLAPFFVASASFGVQGILFNPNRNNDYTLRFSLNSLWKTIPFYARRLFLFKMSAVLLLPLLFLRDRRIWFGLAGMMFFVFTLLFLPGRRYEAYVYLPLVGLAIALAATASRFRPAWGAAALVLWLPWNVIQMRAEQREKLRKDDVAFAFVDRLERWVRVNPGIRTLIYDGPLGEFHDWGILAAWNITHHTGGMKAFFLDTPEARAALASEPVAYARWDNVAQRVAIQIHSPLPPPQ